MLRFPLILLALALGIVGGCRDQDPARVVEEDAMAYFDCATVDVRYAGSYDALLEAQRVELYEVYSECGGAATYRCEVYDDGDFTTTTCCRFGEPACDGYEP
jgi:hypothetical protein